MNFNIITDFHQTDKKKWSEFVTSHENGNIFQSPEMYEFYLSQNIYEPVLLYCTSSMNEIVGLLVALIQKENFKLFSMLSFRSIIWGGPLIINEDKNLLSYILSQYDDIIKKKAIYSQFRNIFDQNKINVVFKDSDYTYEDHLDIIFDISKPQNFLWDKIHPTRRKQIKRSYKRGMTTLVINNPSVDVLERCYSIIRTVYNEVKLPIPDIDFFVSMKEHLFKVNKLKLFVAKFNDQIIGCRFVLIYKKCIYDWFAGSLKEHYDKYPNDVLPWEIIKWGNINKFKIFDFGGAGKPDKPYGVRDYKKKFGGNFVNYGRYTKVHSPMKMQIAKKGFKIWQTIKSIQKTS